MMGLDGLYAHYPPMFFDSIQQERLPD